mmetsp:Transcript_15720/g.34949  ORF Transcript_15720/g.34949 Transcript_15720/m.34949 type:complete len:92 (+) Transcript_15720:2744-3019(+)
MLLPQTPPWLRCENDTVTVFFSLYDMGYRNYQAGEWEVAKYYFEQTLDMLEGATPGATERDGPSEALLSFMKNRDFKPGDKWGGARSLTSK